MSRIAWKGMLAVAAVTCLALLARAADEPTKGEPRPGKSAVRVATASYAGGKTSECFSDGFLAAVERHTKIPVDRHFTKVELASERLFEFPFLVMTGEGRFELPDIEARSLRAFLDRGGFILASAGCSDDKWAASFRLALQQVYKDRKLQPLSLDHPVFHTLYDITQLRGKKRPVTDVIYGLEIDGRLVMVFSPMGLNDTANAGGGCCCCGGNELRDADLINANILAYALTH
jgi:hypothetical protein